MEKEGRMEEPGPDPGTDPPQQPVIIPSSVTV